MHTPRPFIIAGGIAAATAAVYTRRRSTRRRDLARAQTAPQYRVPPSRPTPRLDLTILQPDDLALFLDEADYQWEIGATTESRHLPGGLSSKMQVWSDNPRFLRLFADPAHGNYACLTTTTCLEEKSVFLLVDNAGVNHRFPAIRYDTLQLGNVMHGHTS